MDEVRIANTLTESNSSEIEKRVSVRAVYIKSDTF